MRRVRRKYHWGVCALATGLLTATAWADPPVTAAPPPPPPGLGPVPPPGLVPVQPTGPMGAPRRGPGPGNPGAWLPQDPKAARKQWWHDTFIGRPADFVEPPLGFYVREHFNLMRAKADPHRFTLYRTDFLENSDRLSPIGASRLNQMAGRLSTWLGPVVIEWSPGQPGLAEARRTAVLGALTGAGLPVVAERVVIGPSPYPGGLGADGVNYYNMMIMRDVAAGSTYSYSPTSSSGFGFNGGGGGGGGGGGSQ